jgi:hypothetical protein
MFQNLLVVGCTRVACQRQKAEDVERTSFTELFRELTHFSGYTDPLQPQHNEQALNSKQGMPPPGTFILLRPITDQTYVSCPDCLRRHINEEASHRKGEYIKLELPTNVPCYRRVYIYELLVKPVHVKGHFGAHTT